MGLSSKVKSKASAANSQARNPKNGSAMERSRPKSAKMNPKECYHGAPKSVKLAAKVKGLST